MISSQLYSAAISSSQFSRRASHCHHHSYPADICTQCATIRKRERGYVETKTTCLTSGIRRTNADERYEISLCSYRSHNRKRCNHQMIKTMRSRLNNVMNAPLHLEIVYFRHIVALASLHVIIMWAQVAFHIGS